MESVGEESLDFIGEDTSERLGAVRLRKVQQKINRCILQDVGRVKMPTLGVGPIGSNALALQTLSEARNRENEKFACRSAQVFSLKRIA